MGAAQNYQSISRRPPDIEDYIDMMRRYRSWIVGPMFAGLVIAVVAAFLQPDTFVSYAVMQIVPPQVPEKLVPSATSTQMVERIRQLQTDITSRTTLTEIISKLELYKKDVKKKPMEDVLLSMRKDLVIAPIESANDRRLASAFQIRFRYIDKYKVTAVVNEFVNRFMAQNLTVAKASENVTSNFLNDQLAGAKQRMDQADAAITAFTRENEGIMPAQASSNAQAMVQLQMQVMNLSQQMTRDQQEKMELDTQLQNLKSDQNIAAANLEQTLTNQANPVRNDRLLEMGKQISDLKRQLASALHIYGDKYPQIADLKAQIENLEQQEADLRKEDSATQQASGPTTTKVTNPRAAAALQQYSKEQNILQQRIANKNMNIEEEIRQRAALEKQLQVYQRRNEAAPLNEQRYAALVTDFNLAKAAYQKAVENHNSSETSRSLDAFSAGETLSVLDQPTIPEKAVDPDRWVWAGGGTFIGLLCGLMMAGAKELKNTSLKNLKDVRAYTNLPVLSSIPLLENALLVRRKRRLVWLAWASAIVVGCVLMTGSIFYYYSA